MKLELGEIWEFMELAPTPTNVDQGSKWVYQLVAGDSIIHSLTSTDILNLKKEAFYDTELLPSIFTFREILWQPNVYNQASACIPQLNILSVFCEEFKAGFIDERQDIHWPFIELLEDLAKHAQKASSDLQVADSKKTVSIAKILGEFRRKAFPIIKFFIFHPLNRPDYYTDAIHRMNYAVKIMLTQYNNKYFELEDPFWNIGTNSKTSLKQPETSSNDKKSIEQAVEKLK